MATLVKCKYAFHSAEGGAEGDGDDNDDVSCDMAPRDTVVRNKMRESILKLRLRAV